MRWLVLLLTIGCASTNNLKLLKQDRENKELELMYLKEMKIAQANNDQEAFNFFFQEYMKIPRLDIPQDLKNHKNYFQGGDRIKY
tara:strand:- start:1236 stop:1490 length:255 start_codon:yes stop_codon:yes gene_type:complete